jgi:hypothetical protein
LAPAAAVVVLVACAALTIFAFEGFDVYRQFGQQRRAWAAQPLERRETEPGFRANTRFLRWARTRIHAAGGDQTTFWLPRQSQYSPAYEWAMYELAPARAVRTPATAKWVVLYGEPVASMQLDHRHWRVTSFAANYAIAEALR